MRLTGPRWAAVLALAALVPVVAFAVDRAVPVVALSAACVVVIAGSLYLMFAETEPAEAAARDG